ncbi:MAG: pyridoxamine 5'-phosphate oxidase family protein [Abditibacteriota bacterium]|nr:pyridoxamine 5'-phosphate oxidase family protein [Abditibacteriota bacterium]
MFRKLKREKQALLPEECARILKEEKRGVLSVIGDNGYPYGMPMNHYYCEEDGKLYFHSGKTGHRTDSLLKNNKASFCVYDRGVRREGEWALEIKSVIIFGRVEMISDKAKALDMVRRLSRKFTRDEAWIERETEAYGDAMLMFALVPEHISGKRVREE